jgi:hypothetical protein
MHMSRAARAWLPIVAAITLVAAAGPACAQITLTTFTKSFGVASIIVGGTTSLSFSIHANIGGVGDSFTDTLPSGLVVATPNGFNGLGSGCTTGGTVTANPGSSSVGFAGVIFFDETCTFSVNVTATTPGVKLNTAADESGSTATAELTVTTPPIPALSPAMLALLLGGLLASGVYLLRRGRDYTR